MKIISLTIIIAFSVIQLNAQIDLENISYTSNHLEKIKHELFNQKNIVLSKETQQKILEKHQVNPLPFEYFIGWMIHFKNRNNPINNEALNKTKDLNIEDFCDCESTKNLKYECSRFVKSLVMMTHQFEMIEAFKVKDKATYLRLFQRYEYDIETEFSRFKRKVFPERYSFCEQPKFGVVFWYKDTVNIIMNFIKVDYLFYKNEPREALSQFSRVMNNNIIYYKHSDFLQKLIAERVANYITQKGVRKAFKQKLKNEIDNFIKNGKTNRKGITYNHDVAIFDVRLALETLSEEGELTTEQKKRAYVALPAKTKKEIVKEFKQSLIYKVMTKKRFLKKYSG